MHYLAYTRVSTTRQGTNGVSLPEQRRAIERYATSHQLKVTQWYEEQCSAADTGRPVFRKMVTRLRKSASRGLLIHKVDRSMRNLRDWALLGELIDTGVDIRFVDEDMDLSSRGGRLSADIQAVIAADYVRNLRQEARKGFEGRLRQGLYPLPASIGYVNNGSGRMKTPDPMTAPLVVHAFKRYATGSVSLRELGAELHAVGMRTRTGHTLSRNSLSKMLHNPFYCGVLQVKNIEPLPGIHTPIISRSLFDTVQKQLRLRTTRGSGHHTFRFRGRIFCGFCHSALYGESQKGHVYYRCHVRHATCSIPEHLILESVRNIVSKAYLDHEKGDKLQARIGEVFDSSLQEKESLLSSLNLRKGQLLTQRERFVRAYSEHVLLPSEAKERIASVDADIESLAEQMANIQSYREQHTDLVHDARVFLVAPKTGSLTLEQQCSIIRAVVKEITVTGKQIDVNLNI